MLTSLTKREKEVLDFIKVSTQINGFAPTLKEIRSHLELRSISTVHEHIQNLKRKGMLSKEMSQPRSLKIIDQKLDCEDLIEVSLVYRLNDNSVLENLNASRLLKVHKLMLKDEGSYIAIEINNDNYLSSGILPKDIILLKQTEIETIGSMHLVRLNGRFYMLGIIKSIASGKTFFEKGDAQKTILKNYEVIGEVVTLIRKYSQP